MTDFVNNHETQLTSSCSGVTPAPLSNKKIIVSIILTESTSSLLKLNLPDVKEVTSNSDSRLYKLTADPHLGETSTDVSLSTSSSKFTDYWFGDIDDGFVDDNTVVQKEIAYFCKDPIPDYSGESINLATDLSNLSLTVLQHNDSCLSARLEPVEVYARPLFSIKSMAHHGKIESKDNNIYLKTLRSETSAASSDWINVCRICHGGESIGNLVEPCRCRGSIALAHLECLEHWLKESSNSHCELCRHHFDIIREPKYSVPWSVLVFLRHPGEHGRELILDLLAFLVYTPSAIASTYMLMLLCESAAKSSIQYNKSISAHVMAFTAIFGMAAIDFTYSSWLMVSLQRHVFAWRSWYRNNCNLKIILPDRKHKKHRSKSLGSIES